MVEAMASSPLPPLAPCPDRRFVQALRYLSANLPSRSQDDVSGELRTEAYSRTLGKMPEKQISYLVAQALTRCKWFPTIAECIEIAGEWNRPDASERSRAGMIARRERQARWDDLREKIHTGAMDADAIAELPLALRVRLDTENLIRIDGEGRVLRVLVEERLQ